MKRIIFLCFLCLISALFCVSYAEFNDRPRDYYTSLDEEGVEFLLKFQTCSPFKYEDEILYGKTKDGRCHYSYKEKHDIIHCFLPMQVAIGYSTTAQDVIEYANDYEDISNERLNQNNDIRKIMLDYCKIKQR